MERLQEWQKYDSIIHHKEMTALFFYSHFTSILISHPIYHYSEIAIKKKTSQFCKKKSLNSNVEIVLYFFVAIQTHQTLQFIQKLY